MIKKLLMYCAVFMAGTAIMNAQNDLISILGGSTSVDWGGDLDMSTTDGITYTYSGLVVEIPAEGSGVDAGVKFRKDHQWTTNWGGNGFPSGTATQGGANIPATNGTWDVTFNKNTGAYVFTPAGVTYDTVTLMGGGMTMTLSTDDGVHYWTNASMLAEATYTFSVNGGAAWGATGFPSGTAVEGGAVPVPANTYNITFNTETAAYSFGYVTVSVIGAGAVNWDTDVDFTTEDGLNYVLVSQLFNGGEIKFRQNHAWDMSWGSGEFPSGTLTSPGENFVVPAGTHTVSFNRSSGEFNFATFAGTAVNVKNSIVVYPNPSATVWNFSGNDEIELVELTDLTGKTIATQTVNGNQAAVNAASLSTGIYFAKITTNHGSTVIRLVKN